MHRLLSILSCSMSHRNYHRIPSSSASITSSAYVYTLIDLPLKIFKLFFHYRLAISKQGMNLPSKLQSVTIMQTVQLILLTKFATSSSLTLISVSVIIIILSVAIVNKTNDTQPLLDSLGTMIKPLWQHSLHSTSWDSTLVSRADRQMLVCQPTEMNFV